MFILMSKPDGIVKLSVFQSSVSELSKQTAIKQLKPRDSNTHPAVLGLQSLLHAALSS